MTTIANYYKPILTLNSTNCETNRIYYVYCIISSNNRKSGAIISLSNRFLIIAMKLEIIQCAII
jgi:hypothetical protein